MKLHTIKNSICLILFSSLMLWLTACLDTPLYNDIEVGDGTAELDMKLTFFQITGDLTTRADEDNFGGVSGGTSGTAIGAIKDLCVLFYSDGVLKYKLDESQLKNYVCTNTPTEDADAIAAFKIRGIDYGKYHIYAVANMKNSLYTQYKDNIETEQGLKEIVLDWKPTIEDNNQMFGYFTYSSSSNSSGFQGEEIVINNSRVSLHSWMKRVVSKVTVAFDATRLKAGTWIYIESVKIKDIPSTCHLGHDNPDVPSTEEGGQGKEITFADQDQTIYYNTGRTGIPTVEWSQYLANEEGHRFLGANPDELSNSNTREENIASQHGKEVPALYFFENLQGLGKVGTESDKRQLVGNQTGDRPTYPDGIYNNDKAWKDAKPYGSYIEVKAYYMSEQTPGVLTQGDIVYRFMLGQNVTTDYNSYRNCHYKLTLCFIGWANDVDWHIDFEEQVLKVEDPKIYNYRGQVFLPDDQYQNLGHTFSPDNVVSIKSYISKKGGDDNTYHPIILSYSENGGSFSETAPDWLSVAKEEINGVENQVTFRATKQSANNVNITANLKKKSSVGTVNLANPGGAGIQNTANTYIVSAPGTYQFPLVYGSAITGGAAQTDSYTYSGEGSQVDYLLYHFPNYLDNNISSAYIKQDNLTVKNPTTGAETTYRPASAGLVWEDAQGLVSNISYQPNLYGSNIGGIQFDVQSGTIQEGNAVIAITDNNGTIMWSWQIWVTDFTGLEQDIYIEGISQYSYGEFNLMCMNLGWCSGGEDILYYPYRECRVKITAGQLSKEITIKQESHMSFPIGNTAYYQFGRKDPFWGADGQWGYKTWYGPDGTSHTYLPDVLPDRFTDDSPGTTADSQRLTTRKALAKRIANPSMWHNPPRKIIGGENDPNESIDETFANLWGDPIRNIGTDNIPVKTVYDPCPVGYRVCPGNTFRGFTYTGDNKGVSVGTLAEDQKEQYGMSEWVTCLALEKNMDEGDAYRNGISEFYTDRTKTKSVCFQQSGYRDWDASSQFYHRTTIGYIWTAKNLTENTTYNFEFSRNENGGFVRPVNLFFATDGFPVRPFKKRTYPWD